jgi:menaquinol-cytochrome c reductase iron-sulfur subunit
MVLFDPMRRRSADHGLVRVTSLQALPEDGTPRKFAVVSTQTDAWNKNPAVPIGAVYVRRTGPAAVRAFNVVCPHAGCFVNYVAQRRTYTCPCHNSAFGLDGQITDPRSPSPRPMDELHVEIRKNSEVWVRFQNFRAGIERKIPVA